MKRRYTVWIVGSFILEAFLIILYIQFAGGLVTLLHLPPVLDESTPRRQNGFMLLEIQPKGARFDSDNHVETVGGSHGSGLRIQAPWLPAETSLDKNNRYPRNSFRVDLQTSGGDVLHPFWSIEGNGSERRLFIADPEGYPDGCRFVDISVKDKPGHSARWRLIRLAGLHHAFRPPVAAADTFQAFGISVRAEAWRSYVPIVWYGLKASGTPTEPFFWEITPGTGTYEWERTTPEWTEGNSYPPIWQNGTRVVPGKETGGADYSTGGIESAFSHYVRVCGALRQYDTYEERVTFRDLDVETEEDNPDGKVWYGCLVVHRAQSVTTPSGITVTLPIQNLLKPANDNSIRTFIPGINFFIELAPGDDNGNVLPLSPLYQRHKKPVRLQIDLAAPYHWSGGNMLGARRNVSIVMPNPPVKHFKEITLIIRQRTDLKDIPVSLIAPVRDERF